MENSVCFNCGKGIDLTDGDSFIQYFGSLYCQDCFGNCKACGEYAPLKNMAEIDGDVYCEHCFFTCDDCGDAERISIPYRIRSRMSGAAICQGCYENNYFTCDACGDVFHTDYMHDGDDGNGPVCNRCYNANMESVINDYGYKPNPIFHATEKELNQTNQPIDRAFLFAGIELEVDHFKKNGHSLCESDVLCVAKKLRDDFSGFEDLFYLKADGSLDNGFEIVSHPCTAKYHRQRFGWNKILKYLLNSGAKSHDAGTCGLHIHVNKSYFGNTYPEIESSELKLIICFERFWDELKKFSRRNDCGYCASPSRVTAGVKYYDKIGALNKSGRRYALNFLPYYTIEFRLWRGTLTESTFFATLEFTFGLCTYIKTASVAKMQTMTWQELADGVMKNNTGKYLKPYLTARRLIGGDTDAAGGESLSDTEQP